MHSGDKVQDRYLLLESVGGPTGQGSVFRARDEKVDRLVAVKLIHATPASASSAAEAQRERLKREVVSLVEAGRKSSRIVKVLDFRLDDPAWIVMEWIEGVTFQRVISDPALRPDTPRALALADGLLRALSDLHAERIVHRDVKPANVMVRAEDRSVVLLDLGLAKPEDWSAWETRDGVVGTPAYMAPEQLRGSADARSDLYSAAQVIQELLTGVHPVVTEDLRGDRVALLRAVLSFPPRPLPDALAPLQPVISRALAKDPAERHADAESFRRDLAAAARTLGAAPPDSPVPAPPVRCVFLRCGDRNAPVTDMQWIDVPLPAQLTRGDIPDAVRRVRAAIEGAPRARLLIAGPVCLGVALGQALAHDPTHVEFVQLDQYTKRFSTWVENTEQL